MCTPSMCRRWEAKWEASLQVDCQQGLLGTCPPKNNQHWFENGLIAASIVKGIRNGGDCLVAYHLSWESDEIQFTINPVR